MSWIILFLLFTVSSCKVFKPCELARELKKNRIPERLIPTFVCIAKHESRFDTSALNPHTGDHGVFQISELFWCDKWSTGKACKINCEKFKDDDITDDIRCIKKIYNEHQRLQGNGFKAWVVYEHHCSNGRGDKYASDCYRSY